MTKIELLKYNWKTQLSEKNFRTKFIVSIIFLAVVLFSLAKFLAYNENRSGFAFNDPLLSLFPPVDVTWLTFALIYTALIIGLISMSFHPEQFLLALQSYSLVALFRLATIFFLPLDAPKTIIPLTDPFVEFFGGGQTLYRDLFFSGHTSTMFLLFLTNRNKKIRRWFLVLTILVGACVLIQHVHYSIDVLAAPFFAYTCYRIAILVNQST